LDKKYSVWQKIDLHIHTDLSKKTKDNDYKGSFSVNTLRENLIDQGVKIFSLTDHNIINIDAYREYYETYNPESDPLLLLGIELDIERGGKTYHALVIFNYSDNESIENVNKRLEDKFDKESLSFKERKLSLDEITQIFPEDDFFFIPHAGRTKSIIDGYDGEIEEAQKMLILFQSPLEKVPEKRRQVFNSNFDRFLKEPFRNKDDYAYLEFSDNHNIDEYPCKHKGDKGDHEFYYVKGSKNYETLRLAFIDPKSRIKSPVEYKVISQARNFIETLDIKSTHHEIVVSLDFSPHLNVIIGGRSSGKSLLMDILKRSIDQLNKDSKYDYIEEGLESYIKSKLDASLVNKTSVDTSIIQINQGDIVNFFEKNKLEDLARKTDKLGQYTEAKEKFRSKKLKLEDLINELQKVYGDAFDLDVPKKLIIHQHSIENYLSSEYLFKVDIPDIEKIHEQKETLTNNESLIVALLDNLGKFEQSEFLSLTPEEEQIFKDFAEVIEKKKLEIDQAISIRGCIDLFLDKVSNNIQVANSTLSAEGQEKAEAQKSIQNKISATRKLFTKLGDLQKITQEVDSYDCSHKEEIELNSESKLCLEVHSDDQIRDLIIDGIRDANTQSLYLCLLELLNGDKKIKNHADNKPESLKKKTNTQLKYLFGRFDNPDDFLKYKDGTSSRNNSPGYNSEKYLQVILNNPSSNLILIDQPEDNLGNKFISKKLVELIRDLKFTKQIFLVTHNPAIVVYGDSESIILAQNDNNKITYSQIKLENEVSQREICGVLDGGEYVFDNRARKYNIQKLLNAEA
jgi:hypothetical protein